MDADLLLKAAHHAASGQQHPGGALYLVATPIGNLADLTLRAIHVLASADAVACEDTRVTARLLQHLGLGPRLIALHEHNEAQASDAVIAALHAGQRVAYVSDAGTPAISDPGAGLVRRVQAAGLRTVPIPGASSVAAALSVAGDDGSPGFHFSGFLPTKPALRRQALSEALAQPVSCVLFEAPHRIAELAEALAQAAPDRRVTLCRELTKQFETVATLAAADLPAWLQADTNRLRGEFALVLHAPPAEAAEVALPAAAVELLAALVQTHPVKQAAQWVAQACGLPRNAVYEQALSLRQAGDGDRGSP